MKKTAIALIILGFTLCAISMITIFALEQIISLAPGITGLSLLIIGCSMLNNIELSEKIEEIKQLIQG